MKVNSDFKWCTNFVVTDLSAKAIGQIRGFFEEKSSFAYET